MSQPSDMIASLTPMRFVKWFGIAVVFWIGWLILTPFPHYLPPDFDYGFLSNKESFFYRSGYFVGFYLHIAAAPLGLLTGGLQMSTTIRNRYPKMHRRLGKFYVAAVLLAAAPGGLIMATRAYGGLSTAICFAWIAIATWIATFIGWKAAQRYQIERHQMWMLRSYALMLSAVFLRLGHTAMQPLGWDHRLTYQVAAWASWIIPLLLLESCRLVFARHRPT